MRSPHKAYSARLFLVLTPLLAGTVLACISDTIPVPLQATPPGTGPAIVFDLVARPLPNIPLPNDVATFPDPTSRTGVRVNASLIASTNMERVTRVGFDQMEGWGTDETIAVAFTKPSDQDPHLPAVNLQNVASRFQTDAFDFANDPVYLVNLSTGVPVPLDMGNGNYPLTLSDATIYYPNDVKLTENVQNLSFETFEEGAGLLQSDYTPALDQDFDGILDHPNVLGPAVQWPGIDNLTTWYEQESDTLLLRPLLPLEEKTQYAVVVTDRLVGYDGQPVRSPFAQVYHAAQLAGASLTLAAIDNGGHATYFGDIAGTGLKHVAFLWTFTTQPTHEDMRLLRDGLYGQGPFARFASYPTKVTLFQAAGTVLDPSKEPAGWQSFPECKNIAATPYTVHLADIADTLDLFLDEIFGYSGPNLTLLESELGNVDHVVVGTYPTPFLLGDPASPDPDTQFNLDFQSGAGTVTTDQVHFWILVPKETAQFHQPFPITFWEHGVTGADDEAFLYAGNLAKQGIATIAIDMPEHGRYIPPADEKTAEFLLSASCVSPWITGIASGRDHDLNYDGIPDSGGLWWSAHVFHTRDVVRQGALDMMNAVRILRSFDGTEKAGQDYNANGDTSDDLAGDFDGDGTPDVGGPNVKYFTAGESLGGIMSEIMGGIDPYVTASAPVSGGGGLATDVALRSYGENDAVMLQVLSPLVLAMPSSDRPPVTVTPGNEQKPFTVNRTRCGPTQKSVRFFLNNLVYDPTDNVSFQNLPDGSTGNPPGEMEIACLDADELGPAMTVVVANLTSGDVRCARTLDSEGRLRIPVPASIGDTITIQVYPKPDVVDSYATCNVPSSEPTGRLITTWEQPAITYASESDTSIKCPGQSAKGPNQCQQYWNNFYQVGSTLVAPQEGLGYARNTPDFRRLMNLVQAAFDPADPINFAPYYMMRQDVAPDGTTIAPRALFAINTVGDGFVNISTGMEFARAAGALPFLPPSALELYPEYADYATPSALYDQFGEESANDVVVSNYQVEGIARLARTPSFSATCGVNYVPSSVCTSAPAPSANACTDALYDADWFAEGSDQYDQQHPSVPMRVARDATMHVTNPGSAAAAWGPRIQGTPFSADTGPWPHPLVALANGYMQPLGQHSYDVGNACASFDAPAYFDNTMARFFASGGTDLYYLSHPSTHRCMADNTCPFLR
jgi:hypothetical protein